MELGLLERVDLRSIWENEASHFTPWLASEENISLLSDTLGMNLELEAQEKQVGPFRADILCKDSYSDSWVLIENQLEITDHLHLGQLLTYAAGLHAVSIIWIASKFREEHRAALDWLNEITGDNVQFFGCEVELWKIADSPPAPKFNIISKPNDWSRQAGKAAKSLENEELTETQILQKEYWGQLCTILLEQTNTKPSKPTHRNYLNFPLGRSDIIFTCLIRNRDNKLAIELRVRSNKSYYHQLHSQKDEIESELGHKLTWMEQPDSNVSRIMLFKDHSDLNVREHWPNFLEWHMNLAVKFDEVFRERVKLLKSE